MSTVLSYDEAIAELDKLISPRKCTLQDLMALGSLVCVETAKDMTQGTVTPCIAAGSMGQPRLTHWRLDEARRG